jgi:hypothetical protein
MTVYDKNNVIQSRDITVYSKPYLPTPALPANTVTSATAWTSPYAKRGWTDGGAGFSTEQSFAGVNVDQIPDALYYIGGARAVRLNAALAELDPDNIQLTAGMGEVTVTPGDEDTLGQSELVVTSGESTAEINTWGLNISQPINGLPFRVLIPQGQSTGNIASTISPTQKGLANLVVQALPDESFTPPRLLVVRKVTPLVA